MIIHNILLTIVFIFGIQIITTRCKTLANDQLNKIKISDTYDPNFTLKEKSRVGPRYQDVCTALECDIAASKISNNMDPKVNPCNNFYKFACGNFVTNTVIPENKATVDTLTSIDEDLKEILNSSISEQILPNDIKPIKSAKILYQNCINEPAIEKQGLEPMRNVLKKFGEWPVLNTKWNNRTWNWATTGYEIREFGYTFNYIIDLNVQVDAKNSSRRMITIEAASPGIPREYLIKGLDDEIVKAYYEHMIDMAVLFKKDININFARDDLKKSLEFEIKLANISLSQEEKRNASLLYNPKTVSELIEAYPSIPWFEYINQILAPYKLVDKNTIVNVVEPSFIAALEKLLKVTPNRIMANYINWRIVYSSVAFLNKEAIEIQLKFFQKYSGMRQRQPRWKECLGVISNQMPLIISAMYVKKYFDEEVKGNVSEMVSNILDQNRKTIEKLDWMDKTTQAAALDKLNAMNSMIGYPDELFDDEKLENHYASLDITSGNYLQSALNISLHSMNFDFGLLTRPIKKMDWITYVNAIEVNAYYWSSENSMIIPAAILQGFLFNKHRPKYLNYGAIGFVVGHEITHGFDDQGQQYDKNGNLANWWNNQTTEKFFEKAKCFVNQYENYTDESVKLPLNGINTLGENIADSGGVMQAYYAYTEWAKNNGPEPQLRGLNFTAKQLFWLSAANTWCTKYRPETIKERITTNVHSPAEFRVIGSFSNSPEFAQDFNCPFGSPMNPKHKCAIW